MILRNAKILLQIRTELLRRRTSMRIIQVCRLNSRVHYNILILTLQSTVLSNFATNFLKNHFKKKHVKGFAEVNTSDATNDISRSTMEDMHKLPWTWPASCVWIKMGHSAALCGHIELLKNTTVTSTRIKIKKTAEFDEYRERQRIQC